MEAGAELPVPSTFTVEKGEGDNDVIVINDDTLDPVTSASSTLKALASHACNDTPKESFVVGSAPVSSTPATGKGVGRPISLLPFQLVHAQAVRLPSKPCHQPTVRLILPGQTIGTQTRTPVILTANRFIAQPTVPVIAADPFQSLSRNSLVPVTQLKAPGQSKGQQISSNLIPLLLKSKESIPPAGMQPATTEQKGQGRSTCLPVPAAAAPTSAPERSQCANNKPSSESIVLVLPYKQQQPDSSTCLQLNHPVTTKTLQQKSSTSQETKKNTKELYFIRKGKQISQLNNIKVITGKNANKSSSQNVSVNKAFSHFKNISLLAGNKLTDTSRSLNNKLQTTGQQPNSLEPCVIAGNEIHNILSNTETNINAVLPQNVKIVTVGKDGIVNTNSSKLALSTTLSQSSLQSNVLNKKMKVCCLLQYKRKNKGVSNSQVCEKHPSELSPESSHQASNLIPLFVQPTGTFGLPKAPIMLQTMESTPLVSLPQTILPLPIDQLAVTKTSTSTVSSSAQTAVYLKSLLQKKSFSQTVSACDTSGQKQQIPIRIVPNTFPPSTNVRLKTFRRRRGGKYIAHSVTPSTKNLLESFIHDKESRSLTTNESNENSLVANNNFKVNKNDPQCIPPKDVYFTTLRTGNGQVAVKVIHPHIDVENDEDNQMPSSFANAVNDLPLADDITMNSSETLGPISQEMTSLNSPTTKEQQGEEHEKRIKKSAKLEKVVANILRSHKIDENTFLKTTENVTPIKSVDSDVGFSFEGEHTQRATLEDPLVATLQDINESTKEADSSDENEMNLKISSVFYFNPDSRKVERLNDEEETKCSTFKLENVSSWKDAVTPCFVVLERLSLSLSHPKEVTRTQSQCSTHCRKRTLDYLCNLRLLSCKNVDNAKENPQNNQASVSVESNVDSSLNKEPPQALTDQIQLDENKNCQLEKMTENHSFDLEISAEISTDNATKSDSNSKLASLTGDCNAASVLKPLINLIPNSTDKTDVSDSILQLNKQLNILVRPEHGKELISAPLPSLPLKEKPVKKPVVQNDNVTTSPPRKTLISLLSPSLLTPKTVDKTPVEVLSSPDGSTSQKCFDSKEFQKLLKELNGQVERKRKEMKKLHQLKKTRISKCNKGVVKASVKSSGHIKDSKMKVALPFTTMKSHTSQSTSNSEPVTRPVSVTLNQESNSPKTPKPQPGTSGGHLTKNVTSEQTKVFISPEKIKNAIESLSKYLKATGTKLTVDNNKYFLLKIDSQHVLVKIPQDFPCTVSSDPVPPQASTSKHIHIQPKPANDQNLESQKSPTFRTILPQSQRSATLMALRTRVNENNSGDKTAEASKPLVTTASNSDSATKVDLSHLPPNTSLLPQRRKRHTNLTAEEKKAKRAKLEAKYPLPPGVIIKSEPDDQTVYAVDDNWTVTSEFQAVSNSDSAESGQGETPMECDSDMVDQLVNETRQESAQRAGQPVDRQKADETDEPPTLLSVAPVSPENVGIPEDSEVRYETPPLLQPMLPVTSTTADDHTAESDQPVTAVSNLTSVSSRERGYVSNLNKSTPSASQKPVYQNSKIEKLKELLKKKEMEIEALRKMRSSLPKL
ncbi:disintegrin and metalloproteinase domain-containing protein 29 [Biomphalaria glabrata]|nr:hypothetical protein BgiMline_023639 [Biomphalaria glabrata]